MARSTGGILLVLGLLAAGALVFWALAGSEEGATGLTLEEDGRADSAPRAEPRGGPPIPVPRKRDPSAREAPGSSLQGDGVARVLPPDAAVEDVRDALALGGDDAARLEALQDAYDAIARIAQDSNEVLRGLQRQVLSVEDAVARGVVLAALGANREAPNFSWLAGRLRTATSGEERTGAFLGLTRAISKITTPCPTLGGIRHPFGPLPTTPEVLQAVAAFLDDTSSPAADDVLVPLTHAVENDVEIAALLVVDGKRACALYASLEGQERTRLRAAALGHAALPGAVRRVLEAP